MIIFDDIARKVLSAEQQDLLPLLKDFSQTHFLIGGTAIALQLGHRKSIDFDFINNASQGSISDFKKRIEKHNFFLERDELEKFYGSEFERQDEIHFTIHGVRFSCFNYFRTLYDDQKINIHSDIQILGNLRTISLQQLLCTKLFACITRNKWKDAVDMYYILQSSDISLGEALELCEKKYFINIFNTSAVLEQLISGNWDTTESVEYITSNPPADIDIISYLQNQARKRI